MRNLRLTSPYTKGDDVKALQRAVGVTVDGEYGPVTEHAVKRHAWLLGIGPHHIEGVVKPWVQKLILQPKGRNTTQIARGNKRRKALKSKKGAIEHTLDWCRQQVGTTESPANSNRGPKVSTWERDFHMDGQPWCGAFVGYALRHVGGITVPDGTVYTPNIVSYAKTRQGGFASWESWTNRKPGDLILFKWPGVSRAVCDHVGILDTDGAHTIEGNTSSGNAGSQNNGGGVYRRDRGGVAVVGCARLRWQS